MAEQAAGKQVRNPLTLIAVFAGLAEVAATGVLPIIDGTVQLVFVWYVMLFPSLLVALFFWTLNRDHRVLYAPSDYQHEENFMKTLTATYTGNPEVFSLLRRFWKPDGKIDRANEKRLKQWMKESGIETPSITFFLRSQQFDGARYHAVADLGLSA